MFFFKYRIDSKLKTEPSNTCLTKSSAVRSVSLQECYKGRWSWRGPRRDGSAYFSQLFPGVHWTLGMGEHQGSRGMPQGVDGSMLNLFIFGSTHLETLGCVLPALLVIWDNSLTPNEVEDIYRRVLFTECQMLTNS